MSFLCRSSVCFTASFAFLAVLLSLINPSKGAAMVVSTQTPSSSAAAAKILSVGLAAVDFVATVDHFPAPDEKMRSSALGVFGGGNAANTACTMAGLLSENKASSSTLLTAIGDDANGKIILDGLQDRNVPVLADTFTGNSPFSYILSCDVDAANTRTCIHQPATGDLSQDFALNCHEEAQNLPLCNYTAVHFDVRYPSAAMALAKQCHTEGVPYSVDVERPREGLVELMANATVVICNANYCELIEPNQNLTTVERLVKVLHDQAPQAVLGVQTLGADGSVLVCLDENLRERLAKKATDDLLPNDEEDDLLLPKVVIQPDGSIQCGAFTEGSVVDTTGAGDSFIGGFLAALWSYKAANAEANTDKVVSTNPLVLGRALRIASRTAALKITQPGARTGLPQSVTDDAVLQADWEALLQTPVIEEDEEESMAEQDATASGPLGKVWQGLTKRLGF